jgi:hypothetical protein
LTPIRRRLKALADRRSHEASQGISINDAAGRWLAANDREVGERKPRRKRKKS